MPLSAYPLHYDIVDPNNYINTSNAYAAGQWAYNNGYRGWMVMTRSLIRLDQFSSMTALTDWLKSVVDSYCNGYATAAGHDVSIMLGLSINNYCGSVGPTTYGQRMGTLVSEWNQKVGGAGRALIQSLFLDAEAGSGFGTFAQTQTEVANYSGSYSLAYTGDAWSWSNDTTTSLTFPQKLSWLYNNVGGAGSRMYPQVYCSTSNLQPWADNALTGTGGATVSSDGGCGHTAQDCINDFKTVYGRCPGGYLLVWDGYTGVTKQPATGLTCS